MNTTSTQTNYDRIPRSTLRRVLDASPCTLALLMLAAILGAPARAPGQSVLIVLSAEAAPFRDAQRALEAELSRQQMRSSSVLLAQAQQQRATEVATRADIFVAIGSEAVVWLDQTMPSGVPVIYCMVSGASALTQPLSARVRGVSLDVPLDAQMKIIGEALPSGRRIGMLYNSGSEMSVQLMGQLRRVLPKQWELEAVNLADFESRAQAIDQLLSRRIDIVWTAPDASVYDTATIRTLLLAALRRKTPVFGFSAAFVKAGALFGVSIDPQSQAQQAAELVRGALKTQSTGSAPVEVPPKFQIVVNLPVTERIGRTLPRAFVEQAHVVITSDSESRP